MTTPVSSSIREARIRLRGESLVLLPERAAYWASGKTLLVADAHFGKAASFRASGVPVPRGTTSENLARLDRMLERHPAERIVFLGDLLHSAAGRQDATLQAIAAWRARRRELALVLVRGNHDPAGEKRFDGLFEAVEDIVSARGIAGVDERIVMFHYPIDQWQGRPNGGFHLHGHVHGHGATLARRCDVGVDVAASQLRPRALDELIAQLRKDKPTGFVRVK